MAKNKSYICANYFYYPLLRIQNNDREFHNIQLENGEDSSQREKICTCVYTYILTNICIYKHTHMVPKWNTSSRPCIENPTKEMTSPTNRASNQHWRASFLNFMQQSNINIYRGKLSIRTYRKQISNIILE